VGQAHHVSPVGVDHGRQSDGRSRTGPLDRQVLVQVSRERPLRVVTAGYRELGGVATGAGHAPEHGDWLAVQHRQPDDGRVVGRVSPGRVLGGARQGPGGHSQCQPQPAEGYREDGFHPRETGHHQRALSRQMDFQRLGIRART